MLTRELEGLENVSFNYFLARYLNEGAKTGLLIASFPALLWSIQRFSLLLLKLWSSVRRD